MITIRRVEHRDFPRIVEMTRALAAYLKAAAVPKITEDVLLREGPFGKDRLRIIVAEQNETLVGFCLYTFGFSGRRGTCGLFIEDLYVEPEMRGTGLGKKLLATAAEFEQDNHIGFMKLEASLSNETAVQFYRKSGFYFFEDDIFMMLEAQDMIKLRDQFHP